MSTKVKTEASCELTIADVNYHIECAINGTCYYAPAILGGPPEDCSPEESECNIEHIEIVYAKRLLDDVKITDPALIKKLEVAVDEDWAAERLWEEFDAAQTLDDNYEDEEK